MHRTQLVTWLFGASEPADPSVSKLISILIEVDQASSVTTKKIVVLWRNFIQVLAVALTPSAIASRSPASQIKAAAPLAIPASCRQPVTLDRSRTPASLAKAEPKGDLATSATSNDVLGVGRRTRRRATCSASGDEVGVERRERCQRCKAASTGTSNVQDFTASAISAATSGVERS